MNTRSLTTKQTLVLLALSVLGNNARGVDLARVIINVTGRHHQLVHSVYCVLKVLRRERYVRNTRVNVVTVYGMGAHSVWAMTPTGLRALDQQLREFELVGKVGRKVLRRTA